MSLNINKEITEQCNLLNFLKEELYNSSSDRSRVIVAASYLDEQLRLLIDSFLTPAQNKDERNNLYDGYGVLSSFSSKITISYRLGLISKSEYQTLNAIRKIRNEFAHTLHNMSLDEYKEQLERISPERKLLPPDNIPLPINGKDIPLPQIPNTENLTSKELFTNIIISLQNCIMTRLISSSQNRRQSPKAYNSLLDIEDTKISVLDKELSQLKQIKTLLTEKAVLLKEMQNKSAKQNEANSEIMSTNKEIADIEEDIIGKEHLMNLLLFSREQIEKTLKQENLI